MKREEAIKNMLSHLEGQWQDLFPEPDEDDKSDSYNRDMFILAALHVIAESLGSIAVTLDSMKSGGIAVFTHPGEA